MTQPCPRVRVVVLNFDGGQLTIDCLDALLATDYPHDCLEIVLVDNGSLDDVVERVRDGYPTVRVIEPFANLGFAGGCNAGIRADGPCDYVALINNDATVTPGWLRPLVAALAADPEVGAVSPKLLFFDRFVGAEFVASDAGCIGTLDTRELGVQLSGVRVDGQRRDDLLTFDEGFFGGEHPDATRGEEIARWSRARGALRVKVDGPVPQRLAVRLFCPEPRTLRVGNEAGWVDVTLGPQAIWVDVPAGPVFDVINNTGSNLYPRAYGGDRGFLQRDWGQFDARDETFGWCGGAVLLSRSYLEQVGLFDEMMFVYYEDVDLSWRGRLRGWRYLYEPASVVRHRHAATSGEGSLLFRFYTERNRLLVAAKNAPGGIVVRELLGEARRLVGAFRVHVIRPLLRFRFPRRTEPLLRWRIAKSVMSLLPAALKHRWREPISVPRVSMRRWETR